jgi:glycosyltransferase involved in cell wall biosynthesis
MKTDKKVISISSTCYNEEGNLQEWYDRLIVMLQQFPHYDYEIVIADNLSDDGSREILRKIAARDKKFKVIFNANNFGPIRSAFNAYAKSTGDAVVVMPADLQEPPEVIADMIRKWEEGYLVVAGVRKKSKDHFLMSQARRLYYWVLSQVSDSRGIIQNFTGFGLYDRKFNDAVKKFHDPYPYFRGLVSEIGFKRAEVEYVQDKRKHGVSKISMFQLFGIAMTGFVNHSKLPLRLATLSGFGLAIISLLIAFGYFIYKILYWDTFTLGLAPLVVGLFFFSAVQLIFIGIIGEYVGATLTHVKNHPLVIEEELLNFD